MFDIQTDVVTFDLYYGGKSAVEVLNDGDQKKQQEVDMKKVDETTPAFRNIDINHVICRGAAVQPTSTACQRCLCRTSVSRTWR